MDCANLGVLPNYVGLEDCTKEENYYLLHWLYRIRRASCARGLRVWFLQPDFICIIFGPMMRSPRRSRTDGDIKEAVNLWCSNRAEAEERYGPISDWDVSSVTNMKNLFYYKQKFNDDITRWDVSSVTNMAYMFMGAQAFTQPVGDWDVSKVTDMNHMFHEVSVFNHPVGNWNVSKVTDMSCMFGRARSFNQDLTRWDMRSVRHTGGMFSYANAMQRDNKPGSLR